MACVETMNTTPKMPEFSPVITQQSFSRKALSDLLARGTDLPGGETTLSFLRSLKANMVKGGSIAVGKQHILYTPSRKKAGQLGFGRIYGTKSSLEMCQSEVRATLCGELYHDLDFVNAQPTLLTQFARFHNIDTPFLEEYVRNRDSILEKISPIRSDAKDEIIKVMFGGRIGSGMDSEYLRSLKSEIHTLASRLIVKDEFTGLWASVSHENNKYGSFLAQITQGLERKCMLAMKKSLEEKGWSVDVLVYDGVMIRRREGCIPTLDVLAEVMNDILEETGYAVSVIEKPMRGLDLPPQSTNIEDIAYATLKETFEQTHFMFKETVTVVEMTERGHKHYKIADARIIFNTMLLPSKTPGEDPPLFISRWIRDPTRRMVTDLVFKMTADCAPHEASLFAGFAFDHMIRKGVEPMEDVVAEFENLLSAVCGDCPLVTDYVRKYFAHMIQQPFVNPGVCIFFSSVFQGTGKDTLLGIINRIVGTYHTAHYTSDTEFWEKHDTKKEGAILVYMEEVGVALNKANADALKAKITSEVVAINPKGIKGYCVPNIGRHVGTTNNPVPYKIEETDRRNMLANPSNRLHALGKDFWTDLYSRIQQESFTVAIGQYLRSIDIEGWNPRELVSTEVRDEMMAISVPTWKVFLQEWNENTVDSDRNLYISGQDLYTKYRSYCTANYVDCAMSSMSFFQHIRSETDVMFRRLQRGGGKMTYAPMPTVVP